MLAYLSETVFIDQKTMYENTGLQTMSAYILLVGVMGK